MRTIRTIRSGRSPDSGSRGNRCEVAAERLDDTGYGVGVVNGEQIHVLDLLPGEWAEVVIDHRSRQRPEAWGHMLRRIGATSPDRVTPPCPGFGRCGGCTWQHLDYPAQLVAKRARVVAAVGHDALVAQVRPSPSITGYRNKGKYVAGRNATGHLVLGAYAPRSHEVVDTLGCRVVSPLIDEVASWVRGAAERAQLEPYDESKRGGELRYVIVREVAGEALIALVVTSSTSRSKLERVANAMARHPAVRGLVSVDNDRRDGAIVPTGSPEKVLFGHGFLVDELAGAPVAIGIGEFVQINRDQARALYERVVELAEVSPGDRAVDLYAGLGGIGLHLARAGASVVAVEHDSDAVAALRRAAETANLPITAIAADAASLVVGDLHAPKVIVVNPPRKGLAPAARELVIRAEPHTIVYVSCGPEALGRDLAAFAEAGFAADVIEPFDLMPGTSQIETVVRLRRQVALEG